MMHWICLMSGTSNAELFSRNERRKRGKQQAYTNIKPKTNSSTFAFESEYNEHDGNKHIENYVRNFKTHSTKEMSSPNLRKFWFDWARTWLIVDSIRTIQKNQKWFNHAIVCNCESSDGHADGHCLTNQFQGQSNSRKNTNSIIILYFKYPADAIWLF